MSNTTPNLGLFKYDIEQDANTPFSITTALNNNWDIIDKKCKGSGLEVCDIGMALYVDETKGLRRYLNGSIVDINTNTQAFLNRLLEIKNTNPDYFTDEETWQTEATLNTDGCVYKFVLNYVGDTVVSVRLPKYPDYVEINAGGTLPVYGNGMTMGLTDGTNQLGIKNYSQHYVITGQSGLDVGQVSTSVQPSPSSCALGITTDPTKSGIVANLDQTKLKLRYFIQIATGSETENNIINDIELNNPYSLFDSKYSDHELNNLSWLKSNGQWNAKAVYPTAYDKLLKVYNGTETVEGLSVKLSTEDYTDYDFVLNTADETFRLPLKNHTADDEFTALILYYYVGETVQNANLIDAGRIGEQLANKQDMLEYKMIDSYINGTSGYNVWKTPIGYYCEQWGRTVFKTSGAVTVNLMKTMSNTNYICQVTLFADTSGYGNAVSGTYFQCWNLTTTSFQHQRYNGQGIQQMWKVSGYLAEGQY